MRNQKRVDTVAKEAILALSSTRKVSSGIGYTETTAGALLLHLIDNLTRFTQTLDHLQAFLPSPRCVLALLEQIVEFFLLVHLLQELPLHFFFGVSINQIMSVETSRDPRESDLRNKIQHNGFRNHIDHCSPDNVEVAVDK
jgi:hypothetical protein